MHTHTDKLFIFLTQFLIIPSSRKNANRGFTQHSNEVISWSLWCQVREPIFPLFYRNSQQHSNPLTNISSQESLSCDTILSCFLSCIASHFSIFFTGFFLGLPLNYGVSRGQARAHPFSQRKHYFQGQHLISFYITQNILISFIC